MSNMYRLLGKDNLNADERWRNVLWPRGSPLKPIDFVNVFRSILNVPPFLPTLERCCIVV
jgi:hypothetical protein